MSNVGGVFTIITNTGKQDELIMNASSLHDRLKKLSKSKIDDILKQPEYSSKKASDVLKQTTDWIPKLSEVEESHILFVNSSFKPYVSLAHEYSKTLPSTTPALGQTFSFALPKYGEFINDCVIHLRLDNFAAISGSDRVRYIEFPGHRIIKKLRVKINQVTMDEYTSDRYNVNWQFRVPKDKEVAYMRNMGQEVPKQGYVTADPLVDEVREYRLIGNGPQTFKGTQPALDLWIPVLSWFKDVHSSLPNFLFAHGTVELEIELEQESNLVAYGNYSGGLGNIYTPPTVTVCELYAKHIFVDPIVHNIFMKRFGFQLIRVSQTHKIAGIKTPEDSIHLHQLKWPVENLFLGFRPTANLSNSQRWHRNTNITSVNYPVSVVTAGSVIQVNNVVYYDENAIIDTMSLKLHDITIYPELKSTFYNSYLPMQCGKNIVAPRDIGWNMFNFNQTPGEYQPSGYINISRGREFYLHYKSATNNSGVYYISPSNPMDLIFVADCINFLYAQNGGAILKFST